MTQAQTTIQQIEQIEETRRQAVAHAAYANRRWAIMARYDAGMARAGYSYSDLRFAEDRRQDELAAARAELRAELESIKRESA